MSKLIQKPEANLWIPKHPKHCVCGKCAQLRGYHVIGFTMYEDISGFIINPEAIKKLI